MTATCAYCLKSVQVRADGMLARHSVTLRVSARAVTTVGQGAVQRRCSGSGRPPKPAPVLPYPAGKEAAR